ncbi:C40 family peptidase [Desulforamulus ruminis]|uniref:C40 family peptidase n=1 Tax=Desulforamulus ruminis TaxID=1564 RepID=UPI0023553BA8|nr:C40 family peptidase [Desulforamulus ruminis]
MPDLREIEAGTFVLTAAAVADVREQPEEGVPLVTQLLMGWPAQVLGMEGQWLHIQAVDGSPGWTPVDCFCLPAWPEENPVVQVVRATAGLYSREQANTCCGTLFLGSRLRLLEEKEKNLQVSLPGGKSAYLLKEDVKVIHSNQLVKNRDVLAAAYLFAGAPYLWGGMTTRGVDCSGLTYMAYFVNGYQLPRDAQDQFKAGAPVERDQLHAGDLVFFSTIDPGPSHVGIYQGEGMFFNARTKEGVTVTSLQDDFFKHRYLGARRYIGF